LIRPFRRGFPIPTPRLAVWLGAAIPLVLLTLLTPELASWVVLYPAVVVALAVVDAWTCGDPKRLEATRSITDGAVQGRELPVRWQLRWTGARPARLRLEDHPPMRWRERVRRARMDLDARAVASWSYEARPARRGTARFGPLMWRTVGALGLMERGGGRHEDDRAIRVYPDLTAAEDDAESSRSARLLQGLRKSRFHGEGSEFHQLRDYVRGDDLREFDWKAFAHRGRPTVREHRLERHQRLLLVLDAGRLMTAKVGHLTRFDWAVHAAGRLARAATLVGDSVAIATFRGDLARQLPSGKGPTHLRKIAEFLIDADAGREEGELSVALPHLLRTHPRRSLVVVFSELSDPRQAETIVRSMGRLAPKHLGLLVTQVDADLEAERARPIERAEDVYRRATAAELHQEIDKHLRALKARGVEVVRAPADRLAADAVTRYLDLKRRRRL